MSDSGRKRSHDDDGDDPSGKKMKNREAARKCREKKVKETEDLKKKNSELVKENDELNKKMNALKRTLQHHILEIKKHKSSGCSLPPDVETIINLKEFSQDFLQTEYASTPVHDSIEGNSMSDTAEGFQCESDSDSDVTTGEIQPQIKGLFTGEQLPANPMERTRTRNMSSRSPSRSPPAPAVVSTNGSQMGRPLVSASRVVNGMGTPKVMPQHSWAQLHKQALNGKASPGLSPVQTVPSLDSEWEDAHEVYPKQNGFPDIEKAVQCALKDPGVMEDTGYSHHHHQPAHYSNLSGLERNSIPSLGFTPNLSPASSSSFQYGASSEHGNIKGSLQTISHIDDSQKPSTSSSMTVSMNHTAELLSQAITNFDASEISDALKKQYVQLAKNKEHETLRESQVNQVNVMNEQYSGEDNDVVEYHVPNAAQLQVDGGGEISYEKLLSCAKDLKQITVQYQGKDYDCNYEQVEQLIRFMSAQKDASENNDGATDGQANNYFAESPAPQTMETKDYLIDQANVLPFVVQNQIYTTQDNLTVIDVSTYGTSVQPAIVTPVQPTIVTSVQPTHLPTTVLSMIEEHSQPSQNQPETTSYAETYVESVDYGENVRDLPSLSLTEDHSNIFEKRRRNT